MIIQINGNISNNTNFGWFVSKLFNQWPKMTYEFTQSTNKRTCVVRESLFLIIRHHHSNGSSRQSAFPVTKTSAEIYQSKKATKSVNLLWIVQCKNLFTVFSPSVPNQFPFKRFTGSNPVPYEFISQCTSSFIYPNSRNLQHLESLATHSSRHGMIFRK